MYLVIQLPTPSHSQMGTDAECYDASSERSTTDTEEDELNYSKRFKTNPFLRSTSTNFMKRSVWSL